ncbi:MAG: DsbA family protein [Sphingomonadales bacterium]|jgi:2-hydroxychromene-2-carboxylate isomerase
MTLNLDLFYSFRSPYSYLSIPRTKALLDEYDVDIHLRPVLPLAVRVKGFFTRQNPLWVPYLLRDIVRIAEMEQIPLAWPNPDPVVTDPVTRDALDDQPYIHRLTHLGVAAEEEGKGVAFAYEVATLIWSGKIQPWNEGPHLHEAVARAGLDLDALDKKIAADPDGYSAKVDANQKALEAAGHWGVPTFVFEGEPFFGQDRMDLLLWRMKNRGLEKR